MFEVGQKVTIDGTQPAEVVKVLKSGKVKVAFWVQTFGMINPERWTDTIRAERLTAR